MKKSHVFSKFAITNTYYLKIGTNKKIEIALKIGKTRQKI